MQEFGQNGVNSVIGKPSQLPLYSLLLLVSTAIASEDSLFKSTNREQTVFPALTSESDIHDSSETSLVDEIDPPNATDSVHSHKIETVSFDESSTLLAASTTANSADWNPLDTLVLFGGLEGSKQPQDFGVNANFGSRWAANWGFPLLAEYGLGAQIGTSLNATDNAVQVFERVGEASHRTQMYSTLGVFQRSGNWSWGLGYDFLLESYYDQFFLSQWRGRAGYAVTPNDEVGIWAALRSKEDSGYFASALLVTLTPINQGSVYWQHQFDSGPRLMGWAGVSEGHAQANLALGDLKKTGNQFVFGAEVDVPLNQYLALYGQANFISPADSGTVDSYLGIAFYPGGHAYPVSRNPFTPLLALANSTMFASNLTR